MKKYVFILSMFSISPAFSQVAYMQEAKELGSIAGQGMACNASKLRTFEMLSHAILLSKAQSTSQRDSGLKTYIDEKVKSYKLSKGDCSEVLPVFDTQKIFDINLYHDGTLIMPDGTKIIPKIPYDATKI